MKIRRFIVLWFAVLFCFLSPVKAEYWGMSGRPLTCREDRQGCTVLQTVMTGSLADFDPASNLDARVFSAVLPQLKSVTNDDFLHFCTEFGVSYEQMERYYYIAMGNCLWADIIATPAKDDAAYQARIVLYLFLYPEGHENAAEQIAAIREMLTEETIANLAQSDELPIDFVRYLLTSEEWTDPVVEAR